MDRRLHRLGVTPSDLKLDKIVHALPTENWLTQVTDESDKPFYSPSEIAAMRYAYRQLLSEHPERFPELKDREDLARSVLKLMEEMRPGFGQDRAEVASLIMEDDEA